MRADDGHPVGHLQPDLVSSAVAVRIRLPRLALAQGILILHPGPNETGLNSRDSFSVLDNLSGAFAYPTPPYADGSWEMYQDFVGGVQFWGYALASGSGDGGVRMWDMRTGKHTVPFSVTPRP